MRRLSRVKLVALATCCALLPVNAMAGEVDGYFASGNCVGADTFCKSSAKQFREEFPRALRGNYDAQRNVAFCFLTGCDGAIVQDRPRGCAWRAIIIASGSPKIDTSDRANFDGSCRGKLTGSEATAFGSQYELLFRRIYRRAAPSLL